MSPKLNRNSPLDVIEIIYAIDVNEKEFIKAKKKEVYMRE